MASPKVSPKKVTPDQEPHRPPNPDRHEVYDGMYTMQRIINFRDISCNPHLGADFMARGRLFRASVPWDGNEADVDTFSALKIKTVIDFRSRSEKDHVTEMKSPMRQLQITVEERPITNKKKEIFAICAYLSCCAKFRAICCCCCCGSAVKQSFVDAMGRRGMAAMYISILEGSKAEILGSASLPPLPPSKHKHLFSFLFFYLVMGS